MKLRQRWMIPTSPDMPSILHKLTENTQFIVITHQTRARWTAADRLYGITMQEKGVSTLVSVKLHGR